MSAPSTTAEVTAADTAGRWPLLLLLASGLVWLVLSGVLALIASIQLHSPGFLADCESLTHGRVTSLAETTFIYGWAANTGLGVALWVLGRLGGAPLRALNWAVVGTLFWNTGIALGLVGIATGDATSFALLEIPRYVHRCSSPPTWRSAFPAFWRGTDAARTAPSPRNGMPSPRSSFSLGC